MTREEIIHQMLAAKGRSVTTQLLNSWMVALRDLEDAVLEQTAADYILNHEGMPQVPSFRKLAEEVMRATGKNREEIEWYDPREWSAEVREVFEKDFYDGKVATAQQWLRFNGLMHKAMVPRR